MIGENILCSICKAFHLNGLTAPDVALYDRLPARYFTEPPQLDHVLLAEVKSFALTSFYPAHGITLP